MNLEKNIEQLSGEIVGSQKVLIAIGDEVRQHLILSMMRAKDCEGMRVGEIAAQTNLSRPAASHHLQILKAAGIIKMRREGTKNYYYFDAEMEAFTQLIEMLEHAKKIMQALPNRSGEND